ncbi:MAG: hypothetical protein WC231_07730 [Dehalococcoidales bacterium]|jgi:hypothetical protein
MSTFEQVTIVAGLCISLLVAVGTIGLAVFAFREIREANKDKKRQQLFAIYQWVKTVIDWGSTLNFEKLAEKDEITDFAHYIIMIEDSLMSIIRNGYFILCTTASKKNNNFNNDIDTLIREIRDTSNKLMELRKITIDSTLGNEEPEIKEFEKAIKEFIDQVDKQEESADLLVIKIGKTITPP